MKIILPLLFSVLSSSGLLHSCKRTVPDPPPVVPVVTAAVKYLALGDSYTIGQSVSEEQRFPYHAVRLLRAQGLRIDDPTYVATTGWTTGNLLSAINSSSLLKYDLVTLLIGVNDQYQGVDTSVYRQRFVQLLEKAKAFVSGRIERVVVLSIPDYSATPFVGPNEKPRVRREIDLFNAINKEETVRQGIQYIDITPSTRMAATDPTLLAPDNLHYSGKEHEKWAQLLTSAIKTTLQ
ncbi:MAG TPA: SGNH/GDSL hydrolase family protein [Flavisolibacter sp.]|jgi:lysophospholipase L1-like esterase|nr:SGNH/GDSL hydrolase family protein [Flavisolibacter sp.]